MQNKLILKKDRERSLKNLHPWIFSGGVERLEIEQDGDLCDVVSHSGEWLALAYANRKCSILGRVISFTEHDPDIALTKQIEAAAALRATFFAGTDTNGYRVINGEGDGLPGLIVDSYDTTLVMQIGTLGMERLKSKLTNTLLRACGASSIYEKSNQPSRSEEGLESQETVLAGSLPTQIEFSENGHRFAFDPAHSQKTGFFLDQREMRRYVGSIAGDRNVLNCFSYSGAFSVYAAHAGARSVESVDSSEQAIAAAKRNFDLNKLKGDDKYQFTTTDAFKFLRTMPRNKYDLIILDPPAFAKRRDDVADAARGYNEINRLALQGISPGGILVTCSCSHFVDEQLFQKILFGASRDAGRFVRIIGRHQQAVDHPISVFHPEGGYLKSLVLAVE